MKKVKGKSNCCNADVMNWFGNVTNVLLGEKLNKPTLICMNCSKPTKRNK